MLPKNIDVQEVSVVNEYSRIVPDDDLYIGRAEPRATRDVCACGMLETGDQLRDSNCQTDRPRFHVKQVKGE